MKLTVATLKVLVQIAENEGKPLTHIFTLNNNANSYLMFWWRKVYYLQTIGLIEIRKNKNANTPFLTEKGKKVISYLQKLNIKPEYGNKKFEIPELLEV